MIRDLTKSMLSFSWAMSLFGVEQVVNTLTPQSPGQPTHKTTAAFQAVTQAMPGAPDLCHCNWVRAYCARKLRRWRRSPRCRPCGAISSGRLFLPRVLAYHRMHNFDLGVRYYYRK